MEKIISTNSKGGEKGNWLYITSLFVFSCMFVLLFSTSTSPLYPFPDTSDSFIFQMIGKEWLSGTIPYKDLFDNKGPLLYAIDALGFWLIPNGTGLVLVQTAFFFALALFTFRLLKLGYSSKSSFWLTITLLSGLSMGYNGGNNASEYAMPLIMYAFYLFYHWLKEDSHHQAYQLFGHHLIYGIALGFCLMTRPSNGIAVFMIVVYLFIFLLAKKRMKELIANGAILIAGVLVVCLPFIFYFMSKNSLDDFYYATFTSNFHYLKNTGIWQSPMYLKRAIALICSYSNCLLFILVGLLVFLRKGHRRIGLFWLAMSMVCVLFFIRTNCYPNYAHVCLPFAAIGLLEFKEIITDMPKRQPLRTISMATSFCIIGFNIFNGAYTIIKNAIHDDSPSKALYMAYDSLLENVPEDDFRSFASYECLPEILLRWNVHPKYRFFALQGFSRTYNPDVNKKTIEEFVNGNAQWVMVNYGSGVPPEIRKTLEERYIPKKSTNEGDAILILYQKKPFILKNN